MSGCCIRSRPIGASAARPSLRARTLLGALEALRHGITTIQDMNSLVPQDEETLDTILSAYAEVGIRVVFSIAVRDLAALDIEPFLPPGIPPDVAAIINGKPGDAESRHRLHPRATRAPQSAATAPALGDRSVRAAALLAPSCWKALPRSPPISTCRC